MEELLISNLAQTDAIADLLVEKGLVTRDEILEKVVSGARSLILTFAQEASASNLYF